MKRWPCLILPSLICLTVAGADFRRSYLDGVAAARKGDWDQVIRHMQVAIAEDPAEKSRARLVGAIPEPYLPHFYLGKAYYEKRTCEAALTEWDISQRQGAIAGQTELSHSLERGRTHCQELKQASDGLSSAREALLKLRNAQSQQPEHWTEDLTQRLSQGEALLARAARQVEESRSRWMPESATEAKRRVVEASTRFESLQHELSRLSQKHRHEILLASLEAPATEGRRLLNQAMGQTPTLALQKRAARLEELLSRVGAVTDTTPLTDLEALCRDLPVAASSLSLLLEKSSTSETPSNPSTLTRAVGAPPPTPLPPPPPPPPTEPPASEPPASTAPVVPPAWLLEAIQAFFDGDHTKALKSLEDVHPSKEWRFHSHLFRAAARLSIFLLDGAKETSQRDAATQDLRQCRRLRPSFRPTSEFFSPRFIEFYDRAE